MLTFTPSANQGKRPRFKGFTIVELIVVITVIGILSSIAIVSYSGSQQRAKRNTYDSNAQQVKIKLGDYFTDKNTYPVQKSDITSYLTSTGSTTLSTEFTKSDYVYTPLKSDGTTCAAIPCDKYTITVSKTLWNGGSTDSNVSVTP